MYVETEKKKLERNVARFRHPKFASGLSFKLGFGLQ